MNTQVQSVEAAQTKQSLCEVRSEIVNFMVISGHVVLFDEIDSHVFLSERFYIETSVKSGKARNVAKRSKNNQLLHRLILNAPPGVQVDHENGDPLDNRRSNLRLCNRYQNAMNRGPSRYNKIGLKGVTKHPTKSGGNYRAQIRSNGSWLSLGRFKTAEEAARAYDAAALIHHGEFARLNFPVGASA